MAEGKSAAVECVMCLVSCVLLTVPLFNLPKKELISNAPHLQVPVHAGSRRHPAT